MDIARPLIERPLIAWVLILTAFFGGIFAYMDIGRLEDPNFTIKTALVVTLYPGATATEVEQEVTDRLEIAIQQLEQVDYLTSRSMPGYSEIRVQIRDQFTSPQLPQVWDELRRKVADTAPRLPPGAGPTQVLDRFGDVYGMFYAITGDGYSPAQLHEYARELRRQLLMLDDVSDVVIAGDQQERITVEVDQSHLITNNISTDELAQTLHLQNEVRPGGRERVGDMQVRVVPTGALDSIEAISSLPIGNTPSPLVLGDIAHVSHGYAPIPTGFIRHNGQPALTLGISARANVNVVRVGEEVSARLQELESSRPLGITLHNLYDQPGVVDKSVRSFILDVLISVAIVSIALCFGLGLSAGIILGVELLLSVMGTVLIMHMAGIELQRVSLGALIIVMGMLTDNSIVVCEGMLVRVQKGMSHVAAATEVLKQNQWILLASTVVGILAFSGIGLSPDSVGEFCRSLFAVAAISLLISWVIAILVTPLLGSYLFRIPKQTPPDPFASPLYRRYAAFLVWAARWRLWVLAGLAVATVACAWGFRFVEQSFFPASTTPIFYVDMRMPHGTDIRAVMERTSDVETLLMQRDGVQDVSTYIGSGATRFFLVYEPETRDPSYAQFIVEVDNVNDIDGMLSPLESELNSRFPGVQWTISRPNFGPGGGEKIQVRYSGPDPAVLRELSRQTQKILVDDGRMISISDDWGQPVTMLSPVFDENSARSLGVTRRHVSDTLAYASEGLNAGIYRDGDQLLPIVLRAPADERGVERMKDLQVFSAGGRRYVPLDDVAGAPLVQTDEGMISRRERDRTLTVLANPQHGDNSVDAFARVQADIAAVPLPPGYRMEWGGEYESSNRAKESLMRQLPLGALGMVLLVLAMFGRIKPALVVLLVVPMSICGVTLGLLMFDGVFGFMALLGLLSLVGMLIKNAVVLVEEIDILIKTGMPRMQALVQGCMNRLRPVGLAAGTTILGMAPLLWDSFFKDMAITMMAGLAFATVLTLVAIPTLYATFFSIKESEWPQADKPAAG